ncbi:hypothetical protein ACFL3D_00915 [Candidatus Omnitrophota bacterium]
MKKIIIVGLIACFIMPISVANGHGHEKPHTFEEALEQSIKLREYYEWANKEDQQQLRDDWQAIHDRWNDMSKEEQAEINKRRQERKQKWNNMSDKDAEKLANIRNMLTTKKNTHEEKH